MLATEPALIWLKTSAQLGRRRAVAVLCLLAMSLLHATETIAEVSGRSGGVGKFVAVGTTKVPRSWRANHPRDTTFIYLMDSASGRIEICSDMEGVCRSVAASEREPGGIVPGRFAALNVMPAPPAWRAKHPSDRHLVYSLDSATAQILACGDIEGACDATGGASRQPAQWPKVVMLYRRADSAAIAGRMYDRFVAHYGQNAVFMDVYSIPLATDWREHVSSMSLHGGLVVALIGPRWIGRKPDGNARIEDPDDPVRTELETALRSNVPVFPVLVEAATMPGAADLPASLKKFADLNAATVDNGRDFDVHMARLIASFDAVLASRTMGK